MNKASAALKQKKGEDVLPYAWVILFVALLAGVAAPFNQFKVPPLMPVLMQRFQLNLGTAGLLMTIFAITGFVLALPAGIILQRLGPKVAGLIAIACLVIGSSLGTLSTSAGFLLATRFVEGAGMGLIAVVSPALIAIWFPPEKRGGPMGVWGTWVPLGSLIMFNVAPGLEAAAGWQAVWWAGSAFALAAFLLFWLLVRRPPAGAADSPVGARSEKGQKMPDLRQSLSNKNLWLLTLAYSCYNFIVVGVVITYFPTFLNTNRGFSLADASVVTSISFLVSVFAAPLGGVLSDRMGKRRPFLLIPFVILAVWIVLAFQTSGWLVTAAMLVFGVIAALIPMSIFAVVPEVMGGAHLAGLGMAVLLLGQNLGQLLGPLVFGGLVERIGWANAGYWIAPVAIIGIAASWFSKIS
ncbi:MAG: MFS transporter [Anaerolineaceae bacterium]|nr:MFS transporter [Anaerolineaceae bacterium]